MAKAKEVGGNPRRKPRIPTNPIYELLRQQTGLRVSLKAANRIARWVEEDLMPKISGDAKKLALHGGRQTVDERDIELLLSTWGGK